MTGTPTTLEGCVELALGALPEDVGRRFAENPIDALTRGLSLKVRTAEHLMHRRADGGSCDGMSFPDDGVILYAPTENRRQNFTLAHELGHWLVDQVEEIYNWASAQPEPAVALETLCDRLAQRLLLHEEIIATVVGSGPVEARHVSDLFRASLASQPVCAIALASRLRGLGAVIITDRRTHTVEYASIHPDPEQGWPTVHPWPDQPVPPGHPLQTLDPGATTRRRSFWTTPWGRQELYYLDAFAGQRRAVAVLADTDLWNAEVFHPHTQREFHDQPERHITCCGRTWTVHSYPCSTCSEPFCPTCGNCRCDRRAAAEVRCAGRCGLQYLPHLLEDGLCDDCR